MPSAAIESRHAQRFRAFADTLIAVGAAEIKASLGVSAQQAQQIMLIAANELCSHYRGQTIYVPAGAAAGVSAQNEEICRKYAEPGVSPGTSRPFSAQRISDLAIEYGLTTRSIYTIVQRGRERRAEPRLPLATAPDARMAS